MGRFTFQGTSIIRYGTILSGPSGRAGTKGTVQFCLVLKTGPVQKGTLPFCMVLKAGPVQMVRYNFVWSIRLLRLGGTNKTEPREKTKRNLLFFLVVFLVFINLLGSNRVSIIYIYFTCLFVCNGQNG